MQARNFHVGERVIVSGRIGRDVNKALTLRGIVRGVNLEFERYSVEIDDFHNGHDADCNLDDRGWWIYYNNGYDIMPEAECVECDYKFDQIFIS